MSFWFCLNLKFSFGFFFYRNNVPLFQTPRSLGFLVLLFERQFSLEWRPRGICSILWIMMWSAFVVEFLNFWLNSVNSSNLQWEFACNFSWLFYLNRNIINPTVINIFYNLLLHVQGFFGNFVGSNPQPNSCFLYFLWLSPVILWKKKTKATKSWDVFNPQ